LFDWPSQALPVQPGSVSFYLWAAELRDICLKAFAPTDPFWPISMSTP